MAFGLSCLGKASTADSGKAACYRSRYWLFGYTLRAASLRINTETCHLPMPRTPLPTELWIGKATGVATSQSNLNLAESWRLASPPPRRQRVGCGSREFQRALAMQCACQLVWASPGPRLAHARRCRAPAVGTRAPSAPKTDRAQADHPLRARERRPSNTCKKWQARQDPGRSALRGSPQARTLSRPAAERWGQASEGPRAQVAGGAAYCAHCESACAAMESVYQNWPPNRSGISESGP